MPYKKIVIYNLLYGNLLFLLFCLISFSLSICMKNKACSQYLLHDFLSFVFFYYMANIYKVILYLIFSINFSAAIFLILMFYFINKEPMRNWKTIAHIASFAVVWLCGGIFELLISFSEVLDLDNLKAFFIGIFVAIIFIVPTLFAIPMALYNEKVFPKYANFLLSQKPS